MVFVLIFYPLIVFFGKPLHYSIEHQNNSFWKSTKLTLKFALISELNSSIVVIKRYSSSIRVFGKLFFQKKNKVI